MRTSPASETDRPAPRWRQPRFWARIALTYGIAVAAGGAAHVLGVPLPWMLGPFFVLGAICASGVRLETIPFGREFGQLVVGLAVGLRFTPATLVATLSLLPAMIGATIYVMAYTMVAAFWFRPLSGTGSVTAFFATAAGGVADMAVVARDRGGDASAVAMVHALRVSSTVAIVPILVVAFGSGGSVDRAASDESQSLLWLLAAIVPAVATARLMRNGPLPNPWLIGPMFLGIALGASGLLSVPVPQEALAFAQVLLGAWLGTRFKRDVISSLPRVAASGVLCALFMIAAAFAGAWGMSELTALPVTTSFLALAPAAVTEMVLTAQAMGLDAEIVTAFHVMRIFLVCSTILLTFRIYNFLRGASGSVD